MTIEQIISILDCKILNLDVTTDVRVDSVYATDLMSDVLANCKKGSLLLTILSNLQSVRAAEMTEVQVVCYVSGRQPKPEALAHGQRKNMTILTTDYSMYRACSLLHDAGLEE
jgi:predicted HAD superfamily phosphohydrolase YqeG